MLPRGLAPRQKKRPARGFGASTTEVRRRNARGLNLGQYLEAARRKRAWPAKHLALLGTLPDAEVAERTGRSTNGVRQKRTKLGIPTARDRRRRENR
jgi:hypothetical protein